jgi:hypothetical protein
MMFGTEADRCHHHDSVREGFCKVLGRQLHEGELLVESPTLKHDYPIACQTVLKEIFRPRTLSYVVAQL